MDALLRLLLSERDRDDDQPEPARAVPGKSNAAHKIPGAATPAPDAAPLDWAAALTASRGLGATPQPLPFHDRIQASFGTHDVGGIRAHVGGDAATAAAALGADAYAIGNHVAFASAPDLHTAAHEAAHVIQQRAGVQLHGGLSSADDPYEHHADAVADAVVAGQSAEALLGPLAATSHTVTPAVQLKGSGKVERARAPARATEDAKSVVASAGRQAQRLASLAHMSKSLVVVIDRVIDHRTVNKKNEAAYKEAREALLDASRRAAVVKGILAFAEFGLSLTMIVTSIRRIAPIASDALLAHRTNSVIKSTGGKPVPIGGTLAPAVDPAREGASEAVEAGSALGDLSGSTFETMLTDSLAESIKQNNAALSEVLRAEADFNFQGLVLFGMHEVEFLDQLYRRLGAVREISPELRSALDRSLDQAEASTREYRNNLIQAQQLLEAFGAGGAEALGDGQRGLFDTVASWVRGNDPRARKIGVSIDGQRREIRFDGTDEVLVADRLRSCHVYRTFGKAPDKGRLFVRDPAVAHELVGYARAEVPSAPGGAEQLMRTDLDDALVIPITGSAARALASLGVNTIHDPAKVWVQSGRAWAEIMRQSPEQLEHWYTSPEFQAFWRSALGGHFAYLHDRDRNKVVQHSSAADVVARSDSPPDPPMPDGF